MSTYAVQWDPQKPTQLPILLEIISSQKFYDYTLYRKNDCIHVKHLELCMISGSTQDMHILFYGLFNFLVTSENIESHFNFSFPHSFLPRSIPPYSTTWFLLTVISVHFWCPYPRPELPFRTSTTAVISAFKLSLHLIHSVRYCFLYSMKMFNGFLLPTKWVPNLLVHYHSWSPTLLLHSVSQT